MLVGRGDQQLILRAALERAQGGSTTVAVVTGSTGVGKTRLVDELAEAAREAGALVARAGCAPLAEGLLPYGPVVDAFRDVAHQLTLERSGS
jgi:predicted ATPase